MIRAAVCALLLSLAACAPRTVDAPGLTAATGEHGVYDIPGHVFIFDLAAIRATDEVYPGTAAWILTHEYGHWRTIGSGISLGPGNVGLERLAQCYAEGVLGVPPPYPMNVEAGYWDCPPWALEKVKALL